MKIEQIFEECSKRGASDIHLTVGKRPLLRIHGHLVELDGEDLKSADTEAYVKQITPERHFRASEQVGGADFSFTYDGRIRFRTSIYHQKGNCALALRMLPDQFMTMEQLGLPEGVRSLFFRPRGLILVTGPTGSGKSTTLSTMIDIINFERDCHILTIEDPIEFIHHHKKSVVNQREVGEDVPSFAEAIVRGLRQDPDVILLGEMRDLATMQAAITAAETGHLVFATLHTMGAAATVDRIVDVFPPATQQQIRIQLSVALLAVISQTLVPRIDKIGRVAGFEIMVATAAIRNLIRENKAYRINSEIQTGARFGMRTMDSWLIQLYESRTISYDSMLERAFDPAYVQANARPPGSGPIMPAKAR